MVKLFIVGFPREMDELQLVELFSVHGLVNNLTIIRDQGTGISKGYAFVEMLDERSADRAIDALHGLVAAGRTLNVRIAEDKRAKAGQNEGISQQSRQPVHKNTDRNAGRPEHHTRPRRNRI